MKNMLETVLLIEDILSEKQLSSLTDMLQHYREFQEELYDYPPEHTTFTKSQLELFQIFDIRSIKE
jgi:hypothetical protein